MSRWTKEQRRDAGRIGTEIAREGGAAEEWLRDKCNWEHMTRMAVILEWGDPRVRLAETAKETDDAR